MPTPEERAFLKQNVTITGDGNVVGNDNTVQIIKVTADIYTVQKDQRQVTVTMQDLRRVFNIEHSQVAVAGDHATIYGGVHFHTEPPASPRERRNRAAMLQLVRNTWIKGVLEQSLHGAAMLELGKDYDPQAVERPWDLEYHLPGQEPRPVPEGTSILEIFDRCSGALLILGEPGSGKTTTLLELTRDLIKRAENDETTHIPVVFNLSSWAMKQQLLEDWLLEELRTKYQIPKRIAQPWIEDDHLLLLLDGLDEVKAEVREKCVAAINTFRQEHLVPLAACSRTADYEDLTNRLHLQGAICLRPLTPAQIDAYLAGAGTEMQAVRATLQRDPALQKLAKSPLILSIMTLAYRGLTMNDLKSLTTPEARRQHLFNTYIQRMFRRRARSRLYACRQTLRWLRWIAKKMKLHQQAILKVEALQPEWLSSSTQRRKIMIVSKALIGLVSGLLIGPLVVMMVSMILIMASLVTGDFFGAFILIFLSIVFAVGFSILLAIIGAITGSVSGLLISRKHLSKEIQIISELHWSWSAFNKEFQSRWRSWVRQTGIPGSILRDFPTAYSVLCIRLAGAIPYGLIPIVIEDDSTISNGLRQSVKCGLLTGLMGILYGIVFGASYGLPVMIISRIFFQTTSLLESWGTLASNSLLIGSIAGPIFGVMGMMRFGVGAVIKHHILRIILSLSEHLPWRLRKFLDYCSDLVFVHKIGGGYIFVHRLFQEHFASLTTEDIERLAANTKA